VNPTTRKERKAAQICSHDEVEGTRAPGPRPQVRKGFFVASCHLRVSAELCIRTQLRAVGRFSQATAGRLLRVAEPSSRLRAQAISTCCRLRTCCFGGMPCFPLLSKTLMAARIAPTMGGPADFGRRVGLGARRGCRSWSWRHPCVPEVAGLCECQTPIRAGAWRTSVAGCAD